ncbi:C4-dicarboxylate ABC transporter permease [Peribacillus glennii]|uniref:C4-dicarboxylate ABC transporter permease n=2 Tax=Peribacillus glennii TaxID=2303991 RepID=A0A372LDJ5_9BACI|nr:C4-dicarboxylate ABC transporter permease [Peribacillus glennii]
MAAFSNVFSFTSITVIFLGVLVGIIIGALPGLTTTMGVALLFPLTFNLEGITGILMLLGIYCGAGYGGSISSILLNTPGNPGAVVTGLDGYPMAQKGEADRALAISTYSSGVGGMFSALVLIFLAPLLATVALQFGPPEFFALAIFGLSIITSISGKSILKGLIGGAIGLFIATIGLDSITGMTRFTFDTMYLMGGVSFIPILIGLFAFSQVLMTVEEGVGENVEKIKVKIQRVLPTKEDIKKTNYPIFQGSLIGSIIGAIPGTGGDIAAFLSYNQTKKSSKEPEKFGKGAPEGIAAPEAANNSVTGGAMVPLLTLGIPGDTVTAIILGALMVQGLQPGPLLFTEHPDQIYGIYTGFILANIFMIILGFLFIRPFTKVLNIPKPILTPIILVLCVVGSFSMNNDIIDVYIMVAAGFIGYFLLKLDFPISPIIIALVLGPMLESNFRRSLVMSQGDYSIFMMRPISAGLILLTVLTLFGPILWNRFKKRESHA